MFSLRYPITTATRSLDLITISQKFDLHVVCALKGPRPRYPRVWKSRKRIGTISKSLKLVDCIKGLSNVKEEVYGALDSFIAWELEFPLITVKKALKALENEKEWKRIIQVTKWMLSKGQGKTKGSYYMLLNALAEDGRLEEAEELWMKIFSEHLENLPREFYSKMISIYYSNGMHEKMFEVFADMEELGVKPNSSIVTMVGNVFKELGMLDKYEKLMKKYAPVTWEYRYIKGKRIRIQSKNHNESDEEATTRTSQDEEATDKASQNGEASARTSPQEAIAKTSQEEANAKTRRDKEANEISQDKEATAKTTQDNKAVGISQHKQDNVKTSQDERLLK